MLPNSTAADPEVPAKAARRRFSAVEKARILDAYEGASDIEKAAICRRERSTLRCFPIGVSNDRRESP